MAESVHEWIRSARLLPLLALVLLAALLAGCGANAASDPLLAAKVNGHGITLAQYQQLLAVYRATNARNDLLTDWRRASERDNLVSVQQQVLGILIDVELMREQLRQQHINVSAKEVQTARDTLNKEIANLSKQTEQSPDPQLQAMLDTLTPDVITILSEQEAYQAAIQQKGKAPAVHLRGGMNASWLAARWGIVFLGTWLGLFALDARDGRLLWHALPTLDLSHVAPALAP